MRRFALTMVALGLGGVLGFQKVAVAEDANPGSVKEADKTVQWGSADNSDQIVLVRHYRRGPQARYYRGYPGRHYGNYGHHRYYGYRPYRYGVGYYGTPYGYRYGTPYYDHDTRFGYYGRGFTFSFGY